MNLKNRDFISLMDFSKDELEGILSFAEDIKSGRNGKKYLAGKSVGLLFSVASTRTRISFQVGLDIVKRMHHCFIWLLTSWMNRILLKNSNFCNLPIVGISSACEELREKKEKHTQVEKKLQ